MLPAENEAQRQRCALERSDSLREIYAADVDDTRRTYAARPQGAVPVVPCAA